MAKETGLGARRSYTRGGETRRFAADATEDSYFLLIGNEIGKFGWEGMQDRTIDDDELARIMQETCAGLKAAGFEGQPSFHCQFEPDY